MRRHFDPADYPAYTFAPDGTPTRTATPKTGPYSRTPNRQPEPFIRKSDGRECFNLARYDGATRIVSRNLILDTLDPFRERPESGPREPEPLPPGFHVVPGFAEYAFNPATEEVLRHHDLIHGPLVPHRKVKFSTVSTENPDNRKIYSYQYFTLIDSDPESGRPHRVSLKKLLGLFGWSLSDVQTMKEESRNQNPEQL